MRLELHPEARAELRSAALWYDERRTGLGDELITEVSAALDRIGDAPESYPVVQPVQLEPVRSTKPTSARLH